MNLSESCKVLFHMTWMTALWLIGTFALALTVQLTSPRLTDPLCGRACLPSGVTEHPAITLIGGDR